MISALLILIFIFLLLITIVLGICFYGAGYDVGLRNGFEMGDCKIPKRKRNLKIKPELKIKDLDHGGYLK